MNRLKELRTAQGIKQIELASRLRMSQSTISGWENGTNEPDLESLNKLATIFDVTIDYLLGRDTVPKQRLKPAPKLSSITVPVLGSIPAGIPIEAIEDIEDWEELPAEWARGGQEYFGLRVRGDSMLPKYEDGDVIILRKQNTCDSGQDCAVMVNGDDATFKRVRITEQGITLHPLNPAYDPLFFNNDEIEELPVRVLGVVVQIRRDV